MNQNSQLTIAFTMSICGLLAFFIYNFLNLPQGFWAVITIAAVTTPTLTSGITKSFMRVLGTLLGAALACLIAFLGHQSAWIIGLLFFLCIIPTSYFILTPSFFIYSGIVTNLTLVLILATGIENGNILQAAYLRTGEILLGIIIANIVVPVFYILFFREKFSWNNFTTTLKNSYKAIINTPFNRQRFLTAIKISFAASLTFFLWLYFRYPGGFWAPISCFFIMEESTLKTVRNAKLRFLAHVVAAFIGGFCAVLLGNNIFLLAIPLVIGFFICGYLIGGQYSFNTIGNTLGIALATMLLISPGYQSGLEMTIARFVNVSIGIGIGLLITHFFLSQKDFLRLS